MKFNGSIKCEECNGHGEVYIAERHGVGVWDRCPVCLGRKVVPIIKEVPNAICC